MKSNGTVRRGWAIAFFALLLVSLAGSFVFTPSLTLHSSAVSPARTHRSSELLDRAAIVHPQVTITSFTITPSSVMVGQSATLSMTVSGTGPYILNYSSGMPTSCPQTANVSVATSYSVTCTPSVAGTYSITAAVIDLGSNFASTTSTATLTVNATPTGPTINSFFASPPQVPLGGTTYLNSTVSGGTAPYSFAYGSLPPGCSSANTYSLSCTPSKVGNYTIGLTVTDSTGLYNTASTPLTVGNPAGPLITAFSASPPAFTLGKTTQIAASVTGGTQPYTYTFTGTPTGCNSGNASSFSCTPTATGTFTVTLTVVDAKHLSTSAHTAVVVNPTPTISSFAAVPAIISVGGSTKLTVVVSGGTSPFTYAYSSLPSPCTSANTSSLSCTPSSIGNYTPSVTVTDADGYSTPATTTPFTVNGPPAVSRVTASPNPIPLEATTNIDVTAVGGAPPYSYSYVSLPPGCATSNTATLACTPTQSGTFNISVAIYDQSGRPATGSTRLTVWAVPNILSFTATPATVVSHGTTVLNVQASGGTAPYGYTYTGLPTGCSTHNSTSISCSPVSTGRFNVTVRVTDARGNSNTSVTPVIVVAGTPGLAVSSFTVSPTSVAKGTPVTFSASVTGGKTPYSFAYTGLPPPCLSTNTAALGCTPGAPGNYTIVLTVTDSAGTTVKAQANLNVTGTVTPLSASLSANTTATKPGAPVEFTADVTGGVGPFTYAWSVNGANDSAAPSGNTVWNWTPTTTGTYTMRFWVKDARAVVAGSGSVTVTVSTNPNSPTSKNSNSGLVYYWLIIPTLIVIVVMLILFLMWRGRRTEPAAPEEPPAPGPPELPEGFFTPSTGPGAPTETGPSAPASPPEAVAAMPPENVPSEHVGPDLYATCPKCLDPLGPDMSCARCGIRWESAPEGGEPPSPGTAEPAPTSSPEPSPPPS